MNFFGHAVVACWYRDTPGHVLGAMLPDFASMAGVRLSRVADEETAGGIEMHHATDSAFHAAPTFVALCSRAHQELRERGLSRGGCRAVAHVGTELLLDGMLLDDRPARTRYVEAISAARPEVLGARIEWRDPGHGSRFEALRARLEAWGAPDGYADTDFVADRLVGALSRRPLLRLDEHEQDRVRRWLPSMRERVEAQRETLLGEVATRLEHRMDA